MNDAERAGQGDVSRLVTSPLAEDAMTRLWDRADASHGHSGEAVAEVRERKRREQEAPRPGRRWLRESPQRTDDRVVSEHSECERCKRPIEPAASERVAIPAPAGEPVERLLCPRCADEVQRGLLRLLRGQEPLPAREEEEQEVPLTIPARAGWFAFRLGTYVLIALAVFALVTWISVR